MPGADGGTGGGDRLAYVNPRRIGRVSLSESVEAFIARSHLGPDVLDSRFDLQVFTTILAKSKQGERTGYYCPSRQAL